MSLLRVSAISYLNTAPLMWNFEHGSRSSELRKRFAIDYTIPSRCAEMLAEGSADIGIIPVAAYATIPELRIMPDVAIASNGAVRSILLISEKPFDQIESVALDSSSRSSAALIQILFAKHWRRGVRFTSADPNLEDMLDQSDAALLIGDPALQVDRTRYHTWDLAQEWRTFTGKPFVFAFWAIRGQAVESEEDLSSLSQVFSESRDEGLKHLVEIAEHWTAKVRLPPELIVRYLDESIHYFLDSECLAGMSLFFDYATELRLLPAAPELRLVPELEFHNSAFTKRV